MKDEMQNLTDLIGALAEDIEDIKTKLEEKDASDKDEDLKRLAVKLEPVIRFFGSSVSENISDIFRSKDAIEEYKKSLGGEMIVSLQEYTDANDKNMRERGIPTTKDLLYKILEVLTDHVKQDKQISQKVRQKQGFVRKLWQAIRLGRAISGISRLWNKIHGSWYKNPYAWAGIIFMLVFFALFAASWVRWHEYREENRQLRMVADKYQVTTIMLNELYPEFGVTVGAYEKLVETVDVDSTLAIFRKQLKAVQKASNNKNK